jgi:AcrR family transcriptional regulator
VLSAALRLVDESGLDALSMRKLAQELGVEAMSLYHHVQNKEDIVAGILELVAAEIDPPAADVEWRPALRRRAVAAHEAFRRHPWAARVWMASSRPSPARIEHADTVLRRLREAGFSPTVTCHAYHVLDGYTLGYTLQQLDFPYDDEQLAQLAGGVLRSLPAGAYPDLVAHVEQHLEVRATDLGSFAFGLDLILDGLERLRGAG